MKCSTERRLPGGRTAGFQPAAITGEYSRQDAGGTASWKLALRLGSGVNGEGFNP